jgi:hypothetical protein
MIEPIVEQDIETTTLSLSIPATGTHVNTRRLVSHPLLLGKALARRQADRQRALNLCELSVGQIDLCRGGAFLEMRGTAGRRQLGSYSVKY